MKYKRRYSYANFGTFWGPPGISAGKMVVKKCP